jgi:hypothetical protein
MHTITVLLAGLFLIMLCFFVGHLISRSEGFNLAIKVFLSLWLLASGINMYVGVKRNGYPFSEEISPFLTVYFIPAGLSLLLRWSSAERTGDRFTTIESTVKRQTA